jgi:two-component system sensor histidine kinase/response regulator
MNAELQARYTLRNALPTGLFLVVLAMLVFSYLDSVVNGRIAVRERAREDAVLDAEHLARITQRELKERPALVESDLSVAATERRTAILALISPGGMVQMAHRLAWRGQPAAKLIPRYSEERFMRVVQGRVPDLEELPDPPRISVMVPYVTDGRAGGIRSEERGVVYLEYDLRQEYALVQWNAQRRMWPLLAAALVTALGLARLLRSRVTQPLASVEQASLQLAQQSDFPQPLAETGPREVARLAHGFNVMVARLQGAQRDSENSRARLSAIFEAAMDAIITVDQQHRIQVINRAALEMFGCSQADVLDQNIALLIPDRFRQTHHHHMQRYAHTGSTGRNMGHFLVVTGRRLSGEEFPAEASISHIQVEGALLLTVILRDVTDRQNAQNAIIALNSTLEAQVEQRTAKLREATLILEEQQRVLQIAHEEQRSIFNRVTLGIALVRTHVILRCNRKLEEVFGFGPGELDGQRTRLWYADEATFEQVGAPLFADLQPDQTQVHEQELVRKDGSRFWARISGSRHVDANLGNAVLAVIEDMSLQRAAEQAILEAKEQAVQASQAKSHFLANMSHEIRTPMNSIIGLSYLVLKSELNVRQREQIRKIQASSQNLLTIINDILDYSKIEAGKLTVENIEFDLDKVLDNVANLIADKAAAKGLELLFHVDRAVPLRLRGDPLRLGQIIINYANNAVKFTEQGEVSISLSLREEGEQHIVLECQVQDTGIGLREEQLPLLFQSFQQADSSTTRQFGGTGLGLAICKQLAALMHGEVGVHSVAGQGSTFWFTARLEKSQSQPRPLALRSELYGKRVLVVDDSEHARYVLRDLLAGLNLEVHAVDSGAAALAELQREDAQGTPFALTFMDWQMPHMNGVDLGQQIRRLALRTQPALVLVTGYGREEVLGSAQEAGIQSVLVKPVNASMLFDCVVRELGSVADGAQREAPPAVGDSVLQAIAGAHVLLVEDNALNREVAGELLGDAGLLVDMAFDGQMALERLQQHHYDLVLMDMQMPVMDGLTATRLLRAMPQFAELPVIAMTANAMASDRQLCLDAGMNDHVAKPIEPDVLFQTLLKWVHPLPPVVQAGVAQPTAALPHELPDIEGLDVASGLRRVRGKKAFYVALLHKFADDQDGAVAALRADLYQGLRADAQRRAHTLKSLAASIGMGAISRQAQQVEAQIKSGLDSAALQPELLALETALQAFLQALAQQLPRPPHGAVPVAGLDLQALAGVCRRLAGLLADDDLEAVECLAENAALLEPALGQAYFPIAEAVRRFDCAQALSLLRIAAQSSSIAMTHFTGNP